MDHQIYVWNIRTDGVRTQGKRREKMSSSKVLLYLVGGDYCYIVTLKIQTFLILKSTFCPVIVIDYQHWFVHLSRGLFNKEWLGAALQVSQTQRFTLNEHMLMQVFITWLPKRQLLWAVELFSANTSNAVNSCWARSHWVDVSQELWLTVINVVS